MEGFASIISQFLDWGLLFYFIVGVLFGVFVGILPGVGGTVGLAVGLPLVFSANPLHGLVFLLSIHAVATNGGAVTAILLNVPGTGQNAATILDGYPLSQQGRAGLALGVAQASSSIGGIFGAIVLLAALPLMRMVVLKFGPPEFFMLAMAGVCFVSVIGGEDRLKGLFAGGLGLLISLVGFVPTTGVYRYTFGLLYLRDGVQLIPVIVGLFAIAEMLVMAQKGEAIASIDHKVGGKDVFEGIKETFKRWKLVLQCSAIGTVIGALPGIGGITASFLAYGYAAQTSKEKDKFGKGAIDGVIGPESANNAKEGGALIPTLGFGIPGSAGMAILMGAMMMFGIAPGPNFLVNHTPILYGMAIALVLANLVAAVLLVFASNWLVKVTLLRPSVLCPLVWVIALLGAYATSVQFADAVTALVFGFIGYFMKKYDYSRAALIIGLVLGYIVEKNLIISYDLYGLSFLLRPITFSMLIILVMAFLWPVIKPRISFLSKKTV